MERVIFLFMRRMRQPLVVLISSYAIAVGGLVLIPGQDPDGNVWHYDFFHAFYFFSYVGTTIGFGEVPYELVPAQRIWVVFCIYLTVIGWLYSIGKIFTLIQEPAFVRALAEARFVRAVRRLNEPFHIVCGYGATGSLLVEALSMRGWRCVVIDKDSARLDDLDLAELPLDVPHICADAAHTQTLLEAGLRSSNCHSVIAVTNDDGVNTKVAVTAKLLIPRRLVICRAESTAAMENMASFDTDHIINPYEVFAEHLSLAIRKPQVNELHRWLGARAGRLLEDPLLPPQGRWLIGGFGRFGQACRRYLEARDIPVSVIEQNAQRFADINTDSLIHRIHGSATDPEPLHEAGVEECAGIIAGTDSDTDNLSIVLTARAINPAIYCIARQNHRAEKELFRAADLPLVVEGGRILTWRILPLVTNPLLAEFLAKARCEEDAWAESLMQRLRSHFQNRSPEILEVRIDPAHAAGLYTAMGKRTVRVADLEHNAQGGRSKMAPLLLRTKDEDILCPGRGQTLHRGDCLLLALPERIAHRWEWLLANSAHWGSPTFAQRLGHRTELPDEEVHST